LEDEIVFDLDSIIDLVIINMKKFFSFEEWIELDLKFSKSEIFTMLFLDRRKELSMTELVEYINSPMSTATGIADRLVRSGCIVRERSETDRRVVILKLTEKGSTLIAEMKAMIQGYISMAVENLTEEEIQFLTNIIFKMLNNLQKKLNAEIPGDRSIDSIKKINIE
jgi:DNA-binding MarR family transcriptional regulator